MPTLLFFKLSSPTPSSPDGYQISPFVSKVEFKSHRPAGHLWRARELSGLLSGLREFRLLLERARTVAPPHPGPGGHSLRIVERVTYS